MRLFRKIADVARLIPLQRIQKRGSGGFHTGSRSSDRGRNRGGGATLLQNRFQQCVTEQTVDVPVPHVKDRVNCQSVPTRTLSERSWALNISNHFFEVLEFFKSRPTLAESGCALSVRSC